jgi:hypothetical protein
MIQKTDFIKKSVFAFKVACAGEDRRRHSPKEETARAKPIALFVISNDTSTWEATHGANVTFKQ